VSALRPAAVIVLAAGEGTRMKSSTPKVLHEIGGRSLIGHAISAARELDPQHLVVVVGHGRDRVADHVHAAFPDVATAVQDVQLGTGHAVACALEVLPALSGVVVVTYGDVPLLTGETLQELVHAHVERGDGLTVLTAEVPDPTGYGRIVRDSSGLVSAIVEHKDADPSQLAIREINSGIYAFDADLLTAALGKLSTHNAQGELYLTDVVALARAEGRTVSALTTTDIWQTEGVNDRVQLAALRRELNGRFLERWMRAGVTVVDPATTWVDVTVTLAPDVTLHPGVQLHGSTAVAEGASVGPDTTLTDCVIGERARVVRCHGTGAVIDAEAVVGPFTYLRPGTRLGVRGKLGAFVEAKNADIGEGSKVPHLTYVGDATIGEHSNIGAASVFVNYDGIRKHHTTIGSHCRTGSDNMFVAPVEVGDGAYTGAGSVIRSDVPPGALAVSGGPQRNIEGWVLRNRAGTAAAEAAERALARQTRDVTVDTRPDEGSRA
jgi:bifunctional UDP-N-acetylglucosamine pyrophosphorylase / glucosamine-1-phosphate N-acetyltransferase